MDLNQLRYFVKLSEVQNFSKAAEELYVTQPTLSQRIKRLEQELGVDLFVRSTRSVQLTEAGQLCYEQAKTVLEDLNKLMTMAEEIHRRKAGHIAIGILAVLPHWNISAALNDFRKKYPQIDINMEFDWSKALIDQLLKKKLDVVISKVFWNEGSPEFADLEVYPIDEGELEVILGRNHPLAGQKTVRLEQLAGEQVLMADQHACIAHKLNDITKEKGLPPLQYQEVRSNSSMFRIIESNVGVSVMSHDILQEYSYADVCMRPLEPCTCLQTAVVFRKGQQDDALPKLFKNYIMDFVRQSKLEK
ncbi:MAG: LysR family transcriptional regulator [Clostridiales bacterium]|nr:LysR family transcriptional regulator [Clostridiales bacterium]